mmetsp:Transcript_18010/g.51355  ORF Transcript_18010/g.51355 Transcript_18010/m.51355 type:complete len:95 (+) Transcript_18010:945-1229(+)
MPAIWTICSTEDPTTTKRKNPIISGPMGALPFFSFLSETTPRFVTFCECLSERNLVARGAGMVVCRRRCCKYVATAAKVLQKCYTSSDDGPQPL